MVCNVAFQIAHHSCQRGYHPLPAITAGAGEVQMARPREGRANTARDATHLLL